MLDAVLAIQPVEEVLRHVAARHARFGEPRAVIVQNPVGSGRSAEAASKAAGVMALRWILPKANFGVRSIAMNR